MEATRITVTADQRIAVGIKKQQLGRESGRQIIERGFKISGDSGMLRTSILTAAEILRSTSDSAS